MSCYDKYKPPSDKIPDGYEVIYENDKWHLRLKGQPGPIYYKCKDSAGKGELDSACRNKESIVYDSFKDNCVVIGQIDWNDQDNIDWYNAIQNPNQLPVQGPSSEWAENPSTNTFCDPNGENCRYFLTKDLSKIRPLHSETLPVPVAVPVTEPVPLTKVPYPSLSYPPPPTIPEIEYDPKLDLPWDSTVPNWYQGSTVDKNPNVKYDTSLTTEDKFFKAILGIGIFVAIAGIVYLLFNPTKNTNPGKDLGENAAFQGLSEL